MTEQAAWQLVGQKRGMRVSLTFGQYEADRRSPKQNENSLTMNTRPRPVTIISWIFIVFGSIALLTGLLPNVNISAAQRIAELKGHWYVHVSRIVMVLSGVFMLYGFNWARWLMVVWLAFHVIIGILHSQVQMLVHSLLFVVVLFFLFRPAASAYFRGTRASPI